jgi:ABC-type transport system substrate-binding protein
MPLYLANMEKGDYSIFHQVNGNGADSGLGFNTTFNNDKEIGMAMRTRKFRRAWSTALDREGMNEVAFLGLGTPQQIVPHPSNRYWPGPEWAQLDAENDPAKSIKLLGEVGWTDTDNDGFINRQDPFGTGDTGNLDLHMEIPIGGHVGDRALSQTDMIVAGVKDAGIKLEYKGVQGASVSDNQTYVGFGGSATINPWEGTGFGFPLGKWQAYASLIGLYWETQGKEGMGPTGPDPDFLPLSPAGRAPADTSGLMLDNQVIWKKGTQVPRSSPERTEWGKEIWRNLNTAKWELGIVAFSGANLGVMMKRNNFRNVARSQGPTRVGEFAEQYYFEDGIDNVNNPGNKSRKYKSVSFLTDDVYTRPEVR